MSYKRGDKAEWIRTNNTVIEVVTILGKEDTDDYEYNRPNEKWELIQTSKGNFWCGNIWLRKIIND